MPSLNTRSFRSVVGLLLLLATFAAHAGRPPIAVSRDPKHRISQLKFGWPKFVRSDPDLGNQVAKFYVLISGAYARRNWELYLDGDKIELDKQKRFEKRIAIRAKISELKFSAKGPRGETEKETLSIFVIDWDGTLQNVLFGRPRFEIIPALGVSYFSYQQTNRNDLSEVNISGKAQLQYIYSPPNWSLLATVSGSIFSFAANSASENVRLLNIDLVTGYTFFFGDSGLSASLMPGFHYKTTFVNDDAFGYFNLAGPQLFTNLNYQFTSGDELVVYLKLGPLVRGGRLLSLRNFEFAQGAGPVFLLKSGHIMPVLIETSFLTLDLDGKTVNAFNAMLSVGYSL